MIHVISALGILLTIISLLLTYTAIFFIGYFIREKFLAYYQNWKAKKRIRRAEKDYEEYLQQKYRRELHRKEKERYPLFYLKEGIV